MMMKMKLSEASLNDLSSFLTVLRTHNKLWKQIFSSGLNQVSLMHLTVSFMYARCMNLH